MIMSYIRPLDLDCCSCFVSPDFCEDKLFAPSSSVLLMSCMDDMSGIVKRTIRKVTDSYFGWLLRYVFQGDIRLPFPHHEVDDYEGFEDNGPC